MDTSKKDERAAWDLGGMLFALAICGGSFGYMLYLTSEGGRFAWWHVPALCAAAGVAGVLSAAISIRQLRRRA